MKKVPGSEFRSDFGFASPNFTVDSAGNLTANSITVADEQNDQIFDFQITDVPGGELILDNESAGFSEFSIAKTQPLTLNIDLTFESIFFFKQDQETLFTTGLRHSSGDTGDAAQGKSNGFYTITIPASYDEDVLFYTNGQNIDFGRISITDPIGIFSDISVTGDIPSTSIDTGALVVSGGIGVSQSITVSDTVFSASIQTNDITSLNGINFTTNGINFTTNGEINFFQADSSQTGSISALGSTLPVIDTTVTASSIDNTTIGKNSPAEASFTSSTTSEPPINSIDITNKQYVDSRDIAFSIAFGL